MKSKTASQFRCAGQACSCSKIATDDAKNYLGTKLLLDWNVTTSGYPEFHLPPSNFTNVTIHKL
jgi:hypothetical protein